MWGLASQIRELEADKVVAYNRIKELENTLEAATAYVIRLEAFILKMYPYVNHYSYCPQDADGVGVCNCKLVEIDNEYAALLRQ